MKKTEFYNAVREILLNSKYSNGASMAVSEFYLCSPYKSAMLDKVAFGEIPYISGEDIEKDAVKFLNDFVNEGLLKKFWNPRFKDFEYTLV